MPTRAIAKSTRRRLMPSFHLSVIYAAVCAFSGCAPPVAVLPPKVAPTAPIEECELRLFIGMEKGGDQYALYAADDFDQQPGVCVKRKDKVLAVPGEIHLYSKDIAKFDLHSATPFWRTNWSPVCNEIDPSEAKSCTWNFNVRAKFPVELRLQAKAGTKITDYVRAIRLFGNGDTLYAWDAPSEARTVTIPSSAFKHGNVPYDVEADLQLVPIGSPVSDDVLAQTRERTRLAWPTAIAQAALATVKVDFLDSEPELKKSVGCFLLHAETVRRTLDLVTKTSTQAIPQIEGATAASCKEPPSVDLGEVDRLLSDLDKGLVDAQKKLSDATEILKNFQLYSQSQVDLTSLINDITKAKAKALAEPDKLKAEKLLAQLNDLLASVQRVATAIHLGTATAIQSYRLAIDSGKRLASDPGAQAKLFASFTNRLNAAGGGFEERRANPELDPSVAALRMRYLEHFQWFAFAPWNAIPVSIKAGSPTADFNASNAVPVLDLAGGRWQWGSNRMQDFRFGFGVLYPLLEARDGVEHWNPMVEANLSLATLHAGLGWTPFKKSSFGSLDSQDRFRLLLGVDLYKLLSGENLEAF